MHTQNQPSAPLQLVVDNAVPLSAMALAAALKKNQRALERVQKKVSDLNAERDQLLGQTIVSCEHNHRYGNGCGASFRIRELTYIQTHWYESPSGCMGGDIWHAGEGNFNCPVCGHRNRLYNKPDIEKLKRLFKDVRDEYRS